MDIPAFPTDTNKVSIPHEQVFVKRTDTRGYFLKRFHLCGAILNATFILFLEHMAILFDN